MLKLVARQLKHRSKFLLRNREIGFFNRLRIVKSLRMGCATMKYLQKNRLIEGPKGPYFHVLGKSIYFQPDFPVEDQMRLRDGISQILVEAFFFPDLFTSNVKVEKGDTVLDLGANIGTTALLFSEKVGSEGHVFAFEPIVYDLCRKNLETNNINNVTVIPKGVADRTGETEFEVTDFCIDSRISEQGEHSIDAAKPVQKTQRKTAQLVRLDDWFEQEKISRIDYIKVDIEGAEESALLGAKKLIQTFRPQWSISSYHQDFTNSPQHPKLVRLLRKFGYQIEELGSQHIFAW